MDLFSFQKYTCTTCEIKNEITDNVFMARDRSFCSNKCRHLFLIEDENYHVEIWKNNYILKKPEEKKEIETCYGTDTTTSILQHIYLNFKNKFEWPCVWDHWCCSSKIQPMYWEYEGPRGNKDP